MPRGQTIILHGESQRKYAKQFIDMAPVGAVVNVQQARRTNKQNNKMWAMLSDVSRAKPQGRTCTPDRWKLIFMQSLGHQVQFEHDLDGNPFPIGHSSSSLKVAETAMLIELIYAYGTQNGVVWTEPVSEAA